MAKATGAAGRRVLDGLGTLHRVIAYIARRASLVVTVAVFSLLAGAGAASATPADWNSAPPVSALDWITLLVLIPGGIALVIVFLAYFPSLVKAGRETTTDVASRSSDD